MKWFFVTMMIVHGQTQMGQAGPWGSEAECQQAHASWLKRTAPHLEEPSDAEIQVAFKALGIVRMGCILMGEQ